MSKKVCINLHKKHFGNNKEINWCSVYNCEVKLAKCKLEVCNRKQNK